MNLVAGSVPQMDQKDVTVVDQAATCFLLIQSRSRINKPVGNIWYARRMEELLTRRIEQHPEPVIGSSRFRAEVSADVDFTAIEQAEEVFNPDQRAIRSEQELGEQRGPASDQGVPGALSNQPRVRRRRRKNQKQARAVPKRRK